MEIPGEFSEALKKVVGREIIAIRVLFFHRLVGTCGVLDLHQGGDRPPSSGSLPVTGMVRAVGVPEAMACARACWR